MLRNLLVNPCVSLILISLFLNAGCATTVEDRIQTDIERFESFPPDIQENIRAGEIKPGFSEEMVRMALGDPDRVYQRVTEKKTEEVWIYIESRPRFSVGLGGAVGGRRSVVGAGAGIQPGGFKEEAKRVIMREGKVYAVEKHSTK